MLRFNKFVNNYLSLDEFISILQKRFKILENWDILLNIFNFLKNWFVIL